MSTNGSCGSSVDDEPRALLELGFELAGRPARVAREDAQRFERRADVERIVGEVDGAEIVEDLDEALESRRRRRRASAMTASVATGPPANTTSGGDTTGRHSGNTSSSGGLAAAVQHDAEPAVVAVFEHEHDGPVEVRVDEGRGRDEQASAERLLIGHDSILARHCSTRRP